MQEQQQAESPNPGIEAPSAGNDHLARDIALYTVARLGMLVAVAGVLMLFHVPLLLALVVAVVVVMPVSLVVFRGLRRRVAVGMAHRTEHRRARREELRAQLRGERDSGQGS